MTDSKVTIPLPQQVKTFIARIINSVRYHPDVAQHVYDELVAHFSDALDDLGDEAERNARASELMESFGDPKVLGVLIRDAKRRYLGERGINYSAVGGVFIFSLLVLGAVTVGGYPFVFFHLPAFVLCVGCITGLSIMTLGFRGFFDALFALRAMCVFVAPQDLRSTCPHSLEVVIKNTYTTLGIVGGIGGIQTLALWHDPSESGAAMALALLGMLYCVLFAEGALRPTMIRLKGLLGHEIQGAGVALVQGKK